LVHKMG